MELTEPEQKQADNYVLDVKNTIYSNLLYIPLLFIAVLYIESFTKMIEQFTLPEMKVIALFVFAYSVIKLVFAISRFNFEYRPREKQ